MAIHLWNTRGRELVPFVPLKKDMVTIYSCGPTVYQRAHVGNLRMYVFADTLARLLRYDGYRLKHVINITDVGHLTDDADSGEDKFERESAQKGRRAQAIANEFTKFFLADLRALNVLRGATFPRASKHIKEQIALIRALEKKGLVYRTDDGMYFDTAQYPAYGVLEPNRVRGQKSGARVRMGAKKSPTDFALWKFSPKDGAKRQQEWKSPWGVGFPGWHIECSAMSMKYLGKQFDIHTGGIDHIPVHHTNEIAQSEAVTGKPLATYWMHGEFLTVGKADKMGKSEGNVLTLDAIARLGCEALDMRYLFLLTHYRKQMAFTEDALLSARSARASLSSRTMTPDTGAHPEIVREIESAMANDLATPKVIALLWDAARAHTLTSDVIAAANALLGLELGKRTPLPARVTELLRARQKARTKKDWVESDVLRDELMAMGYRVDDGANGTTVHRL